MTRYEFYMTCAYLYKELGNERIYRKFIKLAGNLTVAQAGAKRW